VTVDRNAALVRAGWNVLHLDPIDIDLDLLTDVPARSFVRAVAEESVTAALGPVRDPDLLALATALYGPARYVVTTKGRSAEAALLSSLGRKLHVVTHGLFRSTQHAIAAHANGTIEIAPFARAGSADLDLAWLKDRLGKGGVDVVYLEPCNNGLAGWALSLEHVRAVRALAHGAGALVFLDCCRLLTNVLALGLPRSAAADFCALADAFTVSCSKELMTPYGAFVGVRDVALEHKVQSYVMDEGHVLEPLDARVRLAAGMRHVLGDTSLLVERSRLVAQLGAALKARGVEIVEPLGAHAVYVRVPVTEPLRARAFEVLLYREAGIRAVAVPNPMFKTTLMRLALVVGRHDEADVLAIADGVARALAGREDAPALAPAEAGPNPMLGRYTPR
jgi:tryptophanase